MANKLRLRVVTPSRLVLDDVVDEVHGHSGKLLLKLRERIVNGEAEDIRWWQWPLQQR